MQRTSAPIRVLIVDDSFFMRKVLQDIFDEDPEIEVAGMAENGKEALEIAGRVNPDIITLDVEMPEMDGLTCLKHLMKQKLYAVVMISSATDAGAKATIEALNAGAVDFIQKPSNLFLMSTEEKKDEILQKVKIAKRAVLKNLQEKADIMKKQYFGKKEQTIKNIITIGTSTGGPKALQNVIPLLPGDIPAVVMVIQHMPPGFTRSLALRLNELSEMFVKEAEDGDILTAGNVYIAPGDRHLLLEKAENNLVLRLDNSAPVSGHRPSFDKTLFSMLDPILPEVIAVVMTGMGSDGAKGLIELRKRKEICVIAQDENTSVVYGMPRAVTEIGIVDRVVPLQQIPEAILNCMGVQK